MVNYKTPEEVAAETAEAEGHRRNDTLTSIVERGMAAAIRADRKQFFDTAGSASSQHYIDTGRYLLHEEVAETGLVVDTKVEDSNALSLREGWLHGEAEDGTKVTLERAVSTVLFRMTKPDGTVILHSLNMGALLQQWANKVDPS